MRRLLSILLVPCFTGWVACEQASTTPQSDAAAGATATAGASPAGGGGNTGAGASSGGAGGVAAAKATDDGGASGASTTCGDAMSKNAWASWPLSDPSAQGGANAQSFTLSTEVAIDNVTQLAWQRHAPTQTFTWQEAQQYCACLALEGHDDWQLPSRMELVSIVDYTRQNPSLNPDVFPETPFEWFWSASPVAGASGDNQRYWYVAFWDGNTHASTPEQDYRVRCVRQAPGQTPRYDTSLAGTAKDLSTGLTWRREAATERMTWNDATQACTTLAFAGGGWRLPSMSELQSLIDESQSDPAIDTATFPNTPSEGFWAATPLAGDATAAWFVSFSDGIAYNALLERTQSVRCVR